VILIGLSACSSSHSGKSAAPTTARLGQANSSASGASALTPDPNGTLSFGQASTSGLTYNPHTFAAGLNFWGVFTMSYDRLIQLDAKGNLAPMLATSWQWNPTSTQLTLTLRQGVMFQDGSAFNADVAVANLKAAAAAGSNGQQQLQTMTSVVASGPNTVVMTFSQPSPAAIFALADHAGMMVSPNALANPSLMQSKPQGSGAYELVSVTGALTFNFAYFSGYWDTSHVYPAHMQIQNIADENARLNAVRTGSLDATYVTPLTYPTAEADKSLNIVKYPALSIYTAFMNNKVAPFDNPQVREAVSLALNRPAFAQSQEGLCPAVNQAFGPGIVGYINGYQGLGYDPAKAKQLIQSAGATGAGVKIVSVPIQPYATFATLMQAQLDAIGLNVTIDTVTTTLQRPTYQQGGYGILDGPTTVSTADPTAVLAQYVLGAGNPGTKDPTLVAEINQAEQLPLGSAQRATAFENINRDLTEKYLLWAPICQGTNIFVSNKNVIGLNSMPNAVLSQAPTNEFLQIAK
jgi:peptide/nickel transport system substrate-binding protein